MRKGVIVLVTSQCLKGEIVLGQYKYVDVVPLVFKHSMHVTGLGKYLVISVSLDVGVMFT